MSELLNQIQSLDRALKHVREFQVIARSTTCLFDVEHSKVNIVACWQATPGDKAYHETAWRMGEWLTKAVCNKMSDLLCEAERLLTDEINALRVMREGELRAELAAIQALKVETA